MLWFRRIVLISAILALAVIMLGAWVRLSDAGLGCPDWPGCYGNLTVPVAETEVQSANLAYPERPVESHKAWKEMIHRYFAGTLGLLILSIAIIAVVNRKYALQPLLLPVALLFLVIFQAALGMWTVTLQLKPLIVMAHLLGGFATLSLLWWLLLTTRKTEFQYFVGSMNVLPWAVFGAVLLVMQIALGGWTSSNYAALACPDFPTCQGQWWPDTNYQEAFVLWRGLGVNYEFGVLDHPARTAIHMTHRLGAIVLGSYLLLLGYFTTRMTDGRVKKAALIMLALLFIQISLGISNIIFHLPLAVAVLHNGVAALLLLSVINLIFQLRLIRSVHQ